MKRLSIVLCLCGVATAASLHFQESAFVAAADGAPPGWSVWSARPETAPRVFVDPLHYRTRAGSLGISGNSNGAEPRRVGAVRNGGGSRNLVSIRGVLSGRSRARRILAGGGTARLEDLFKWPCRTTRLCLPGEPGRRLDQGVAPHAGARESGIGGFAAIPFERAQRHGMVGRHLARPDCRSGTAQGHYRVNQSATEPDAFGGGKRTPVSGDGRGNRAWEDGHNVPGNRGNDSRSHHRKARRTRAETLVLRSGRHV